MGPTKSLTFSRVFPKGCHGMVGSDDPFLLGSGSTWQVLLLLVLGRVDIGGNHPATPP